jgi:CD109 antigen
LYRYFSAVFTVRPKRLGDVAVQVSGRTAAEVGYADAVRKTVRVEPEGFPQEEVFNVVVNRDAAGAETIKIASPLPSSGVVEGSVRSLLSVVGDLMGPSIKGLERLVRVPTGCGEQNMIGMAPNVYVLTYLDKARQLTDELREKATSNILRGYQRELQYRHSNGAFSAFGEGSGAGGLAGRGRIASPLPSANSGSLWLTAFVVRVFAQSAEAAAGMYALHRRRVHRVQPGAGRLVHGPEPAAAQRDVRRRGGGPGARRLLPAGHG